MLVHLRGLCRNVIGISVCLFFSCFFSCALAGETSSQAGRAHSDEIVIGISLPLSGAFESYGQSALAGALARFRVQNARGGINGKTIRPVVRDNESNAAVTRVDFDAFTKDPDTRVAALLGPLMSGPAAVIGDNAHERQVIAISPNAPLDMYEDGGKERWVFRLGMNADSQARAMSRFQVESYGAAKVGIIVDARYVASVKIGDLFSEAFVADGGKVVARAVIQSGGFTAGHGDVRLAGSAGNLAGEVARVAGGWPEAVSLADALAIMDKAEPEFLYLPFYAQQIIQLAHSIGDYSGLDHVRLAGPDFWDNEMVFDGSGKRILTSSFTSSMFDDHFDYKPYLDFLVDIREAGIDIPDAMSASAYDAVTLIIDALTKCGDDAAAARKYLASIRRYPLATGRTSFLPNGGAVKPVMLRIIGNLNGWAKDLFLCRNAIPKFPPRHTRQAGQSRQQRLPAIAGS